MWRNLSVRTRLRIGAWLFGLCFGLPCAVIAVFVVRIGSKLDNVCLFMLAAIIMIPAFRDYWKRNFVRPMEDFLRDETRD